MDKTNLESVRLTEEELLKKQNELEAKEQKLEKKEKELNALEAAVTAAKYNLYDKINVSLKSMDIFIFCVVIALVAAIIFAVILS